MPALTRRQTMTGIAAAGLLAGIGGGVGLLQDHRLHLVRGILHRSFGEFRMADDQFTALLSAIDETFAPSAQRLAFYRAAALAGDGRLTDWAPGRIGEEFAEYERRAVTAFMTRTDYLAIDPARQMVSFVDQNACASPFARFD
ncbi:MAG: hypothetical protein K2Q29_15315 [Sphingomonadales bacterium]|nr:hypothetical protein [Sphingomonadales bacterium]